MAVPSPNLQFGFPNFAFDGADFYNIDHTTDRLIRKDTGGGNVFTFPITSNLFFDDLNEEITSLKFTGYNFELGTTEGNANLWTLESEKDSEDITTGIIIRRFILENNILRFATTKTELGNERPDIFSFVTRSGRKYQARTISPEYHNVSLTSSREPGQNIIYISSINRMIVGSRIIIGPSTDAGNPGVVEEHEVISVGVFDVSKNGYRVTLRRPLENEYTVSDEVVYQNYIYLFNDYPLNGTDYYGGLFKIRALDGRIMATDSSVLYKNVDASVYVPGADRIAFVKENQLLYLNPDSLTISNSIVLDNVTPDKTASLQIFDLAVSSSFVYRLQNQVADYDNDIVHSYGNYNHIDTNLVDTVSSISVRPVLQTILANEFDEVFIDALVLDQYGVPIEGQIVNITALGLLGGEGTFRTFSSDDPQDQTNTTQKTTRENGKCRFLYRAGAAQDVIKFTVTALINGVDGFSFVYQYLNTSALTLISQIDTLSSRNIVYQEGDITGDSIVYLNKQFGFPAIRSTYKTGTVNENLDREYDDLYDGLRNIDWGFWGVDANRIVSGGGSLPSTHPLKITHPKLIQQINEKITSKVFIQQRTGDEGEVLVVQSNPTRTERALIDQIGRIEGTVEIVQFDFVELFIPEPLAIKVSRNTNIYAKLRDIPGTNINSSTVQMLVNGIDVTDLIDVTYTAGLFLEILYDPPVDFDFGERVTVEIIFYDQAPEPNLIVIPYYFDITEDYKAPVASDFIPMRSEVGVATDTEISINITEDGSGVDPDSILLYVNNFRINSYILTSIGGGYNLYYKPTEEFKNTQDVSIYLEVADFRENKSIYNYNFITEPSSPPEITMMLPDNCWHFVHRDTPVIFEIYSTGDGVRLDTIRVNIKGEDKRFLVNTVVRRIE